MGNTCCSYASRRPPTKPSGAVRLTGSLGKPLRIALRSGALVGGEAKFQGKDELLSDPNTPDESCKLQPAEAQSTLGSHVPVKGSN